jgi:hypothetical protein
MMCSVNSKPMSLSNRIILLGSLILMVLRVPALASCQVVVEHDWSVAGPGGYYGCIQYQTGPGPFDARTAVLLGPHHFQIPAPLFAILTVFTVVLLAVLAFYVRALFPEPRSAMAHALVRGSAPQFQFQRPRPAATDAQRSVV